MNGLRKTGIEGIDRHIHNYKLLIWFLKIEGKYSFFRYEIFTKHNRNALQLFNDMNFYSRHVILGRLSTENDIDYKWGSIFTFRPFSRLDWYKDGLDYHEMNELCDRWVKFLKEHNYSIFKFDEE